MTARFATPVQRLSALKVRYFEMTRAQVLDEALNRVVDHYDAGLLTAAPFEGSGIIVTGESGAGKTREIDMALARLRETRPVLESGRPVKAMSLVLDGVATWKSLGLKVLEAAGYEMSARRTEHEIWARVRTQLSIQGIWIIHLDECQHIFQTLNENETRKVLNALKIFMKAREWPVALILSGIPELLGKVNQDPQLLGLLTPVPMPALNPRSDDLDELDTVFYQLAEIVGVDISAVRRKDVYARMAHSRSHMYGKCISFMIEVLSRLPEGKRGVELADLADRYAAITKCSPGHNPFLREDYLSCETKILSAR